MERRLTQAPQLLDAPARALTQAVDALGLAEEALEQALAETKFDPAELERVEERLFALRGAARKHQVAVADLAKLAEKFADDIAALDASEARLVALGRALADAKPPMTKRPWRSPRRAGRRRKKLDALVDARIEAAAVSTARIS